MAIRDHFRLDVLIRRAAMLQERDAELAEVERMLHMQESGSAGNCTSCGAVRSRGAVFCWQCGAQVMERSTDNGNGHLRTMRPRIRSICSREPPSRSAIRRLNRATTKVRLDRRKLRGSHPAKRGSRSASPDELVSLDPLRRWEQRFGALPLPSPLVWAVLVAAFLGFGVLDGTGRRAQCNRCACLLARAVEAACSSGERAGHDSKLDTRRDATTRPKQTTPEPSSVSRPTVPQRPGPRANHPRRLLAPEIHQVARTNPPPAAKAPPRKSPPSCRRSSMCLS